MKKSDNFGEEKLKRFNAVLQKLGERFEGCGITDAVVGTHFFLPALDKKRRDCIELIVEPGRVKAAWPGKHAQSAR